MISAKEFYQAPIKSLSKFSSNIKNSYFRTLKQVREEVLEDIVVAPEMKDRLQTIAQATHNTKKNGANFRHILLHGPPGISFFSVCVSCEGLGVIYFK